MTFPEHPDPAEVALDDQLRAAMADADAAFQAHFADSPLKLHATLPELPSWAVPFVEAHNLAVEGEHKVCTHITDGPCVINVAPWAPGFVCCTPCAEAGLLARLCPPDQKWRCDVCGTDVPGQLHPALLKGETCLIRFGICDTCAAGAALDPMTGADPDDRDKLAHLDGLVTKMVNATRDRLAREPGADMITVINFLANLNQDEFDRAELAFMYAAALLRLARGRPASQP